MNYYVDSSTNDWDALRSVYRRDEQLFWYAMRQLAAAYARSRHEPTLLTLSNLDAFVKARWEGQA